MDHTNEKWTQYFLDHDELDLLRTLRVDPRLTPSGTVIDVDVGVVTGLNDFFILNAQQVREHSLESYTQPVVTRSGHLSGIVFCPEDWETNVTNLLPSHMLRCPGDDTDKLPVELKAYIRQGEAVGVHTGYKCRIRPYWYKVPSTWVPDAFMLRQVHGYPKIILNQTAATCTDTIHRIRFRNGALGKVIAPAFLNSLTFAFTEVTGRSYGGGVLELEPNEAERLPLPLIGAEQLDFNYIHNLLLQGNIESVLNVTDHLLLVEGLGLSLAQVQRLRGIWAKLRDRRINRKHHKVLVDI